MPVDYSKWDNIELSDDDDFECHPNVDKASMIRWKQAQVHQKRRERQDKISALKLEMSLSQRMVDILQVIEPMEFSLRLEKLKALQLDAIEWTKQFEKDVFTMVMAGRDPRWEPPVPDEFVQKRIPLDQLVQELLSNHSIEKPKEEIQKNFEEAIQRLKSRQFTVQEEIVIEEKAIQGKITTETLKTGFNKTMIAKKPEPNVAAAAAETSSRKVVETIHTPNEQEHQELKEQQEPQDQLNEEEADYITYPPAEKFAYAKGLEESYKLLGQYPELSCQKYSDEILAEAFRLEMKGNFEEAKNCVHQSLMLQYCGLLGKDGVSLFFTRLKGPSPQARDMFSKDIHDTYNRISKRVKELHAQSTAEEEKEREEGLLRLKAATQEDGTLALPIGPDGEGEERAKVFASFPRSFQEALLLQDVDKINEYLASVDKEEAERVVKLADKAGLLTLQEDSE